MADVGVHSDAVLVGARWRRPYFGGAPFGFAKEAGTSAGTTRKMIDSCHFKASRFEYIVKPAIHDGIAPKRAEIFDTVLEKPHVQWGEASRPEGGDRARTAVIDIFRADLLRLTDIDQPPDGKPSDVATFRIVQSDGVEVTGRLQPMLDAADAAGRPLVACDARHEAAWAFEHPGRWRGGLYRAAGAVARTKLVERKGGRARLATTAAGPVVGISKMAARDGETFVAARIGRHKVDLAAAMPEPAQQGVEAEAGDIEPSPVPPGPGQGAGYVVSTATARDHATVDLIGLD